MVFERVGNSVIIQAPQHFAGPSVKDAITLVQRELDQSATAIVFDLGSCDLVDSSGIGSLVSLAKECKSRSAQLSLRGLNEDLFQLFVDTGLDKIFDIEKEDGLVSAEIDLFESSVDIRLDMKRESQGEICIFLMSGVMNHPLGSRFFKQQVLLALAQSRKILLDFEELTFFDSLSISAVLNINKLLKETGGSIRICCPNYIVKDLFSTLNIDSIVPVFNSRDEALAEWK